MDKMTVKNLVYERKWTDQQIADFFNVTRSYIVHFRKVNGIQREMTIGRKGELLAIEKLKEKGYEVKDMNLIDKTTPYDLLVNNEIRIEVKTASLSKGSNSYLFTLANPPRSNCIESDTRTILKSGKSLKYYEKTCDIMMFVGITEGLFWIVPSELMKKRISTVNLHTRRSRYIDYLDNFKEIEKALELSANLKQDFNKY